MAVDHVQTENNASMSSLVSGIINDAQQLIRQEVTLARREIQLELNKAKVAAISFGIGAAVAFLGTVMLCFFVVWALTALTGMENPWLWFLVVGVVFLGAGAGLFFLAKKKIDQINLVPPQTAETMKENVQWLKTQT